MQASLWDEMDEVFGQALERTGAEREAYLAEACLGRASLRAEVDRLLALDRQAPSSFLCALEPPVVIGPYRVEREIHRSEMSVVYEGRRQGDDFSQTVAIKVSAGHHDAALRRRFEAERRIQARLEHANIARLYDGGTLEDGRPFLVMEHIRGLPITDYCERQRCTIRQRIELFLRMLDAVEFAHRHLVVHRDLKPGNVLVTEGGEPKLLDFGIAKVREASELFGPAVATAADQRLFTPGYASPEQVKGEPVGVASDVYSAGVLLYELLTGSVPYSLEGQASLPEVLEAICLHPPRQLWAPFEALERAGRFAGSFLALCQERRARPRELRTLLSGDLATVLAVSLRKEPGRRYGSISEMAGDLRRFLECRPLRAKPDTLGYRARKFAVRHRLGLGAMVLVVVAAAAVFLLVLRQSTALALERDKVSRSLDALVEVFSLSDAERSLGASVPARLLLERGAQGTLLRLEDDPELQRSMLATLGRIYFQIGLTEEARQLFHEGLERAERGADDLASAEPLLWLGKVATAEGRVAEARPLLDRSLSLRRRSLGGGHPQVAASLEALGELQTLTYQYDQAEASLREAVAIRRRHREATKLAQGLERLATVLSETDRAEEAVELFEEALGLRLEAQGSEHPARLVALRKLASLYLARGEHGKAVPLLEETLSSLRQTLGGEHVEVAQAMAKLASSYYFLDRPEEAEEQLRGSIEIQRRLAGGDTPAVADALGDLVLIVRTLGRYDEAGRLVAEHQELVRRFFGDEHPKVAFGYYLQAGNELARGDLAAAEAAIARTLALNRLLLPPSHRAHAYPLLTLAKIRLRQDRYSEAEALLLSALPILERSHPPGHWRLSDARVLLAFATAGQARFVEARSWLNQARAELPGELTASSPVMRRAKEAERRIVAGAVNAAGMEPFRGGALSPPRRR